MTLNKEVFGRIIHIGSIKKKGTGPHYLFLREASKRYAWFVVDPMSNETETDVWANTIEESLRLAAKRWKNNGFRTIASGFRYTMPERDEHGTNALFFQMAASYASVTGVYFDEELSSNCIVHNASIEARDLLKKLQSTQKMS
jgi:hypothetical protein